MIRLLAVDIDGTLLDGRGQIPPSHREALVEASARGIALVLATGRSFHFARPVAEALELPLTLIVNNGAVVKDPGGATMMRRLLRRDLALGVLAHAAGREDSVAVVFNREPGEVAHEIVFERMDWTHPNRRGYYERNKAFIGTVSPLASAITEDPIQVMFNGGVLAMRALAAELRALPVAQDISVALTEYEARDFSLLDVNTAQCSKGSTLARWAIERGFAREEIMAVGDNLNDLEMLEFAGTSVVMANASEDMRSRGFALTDSHDHGGLAEAVRRFALAGREPGYEP